MPEGEPGGFGGGGEGDGTGSNDPFLDQIMSLIPGVPNALARQLANILRDNPGDTGLHRMFDYLRTTDWFNQAYAGFNQGVQAGLFSGVLEGLTGYRGWLTGVRGNYSQYFGREVSAAELMDYATRGFDVGTITQIGQGHSLAMSQGGDWQYYSGAFGTGALSDAEKEAYGQLLSGRSSDLGLRIQQRLDAAKARAASLFSGQLAGMGASTSAGFAQPLSGAPQKIDVGA